MIAAHIEHRRYGSIGPFIEGIPLHAKLVQVGGTSFYQVTDIHDEFGPQQIQLSDGRRKNAGPLAPVYDDYQNAPGVGGPTDLSGTKVPGVSETTVSSWARYTFDIGASTLGFVRAEYIYESETQVISNVPESIASREVGMANASIGLRWDNGFEAMLWGRNLTDDEFLQSAFPTTFQNLAQPFSYSGYPNQPRTYGLTLRKYFD